MSGLTVENAEKLNIDDIDIVFTAIESDAAKIVEPLYAARVPVISTASAFRYEPDVPVFLPGVNIDHAALVAVQQKKRGWKGFVTPGPNCTTVGLVFTLKPLHDRFGINSVIMTSLQATSGAGRSPGVLGYDILDNIIPYIPKRKKDRKSSATASLAEKAAEDPGNDQGWHDRTGAVQRLLHLHARQCARRPHRMRLRELKEAGESG